MPIEDGLAMHKQKSNQAHPCKNRKQISDKFYLIHMFFILKTGEKSKLNKFIPPF